MQSASFLLLHLPPKFAANHYILRSDWYFMVNVHKSDGKFLCNLFLFPYCKIWGFMVKYYCKNYPFGGIKTYGKEYQDTYCR